jgi:hypothetical protein
MKTRNGKIARLPLDIRDQLNTRLADGEPGNRLVEWLNSNPAVMLVMAEQFDGRPINENNLSEWRQGGYEEWLTLQSFLDESRILSENSGQVTDTGITSEHLHIVLLAHHAHLLQNFGIMPEIEFSNKVEALRKLTASIMNMRRSELNAARLQLQRERLELLREMKAAKSAEAIGRGAGGGPGKGRDPSSKSTASISSNARPGAPETGPSEQPCISPSGTGIPSGADSCSAESAVPSRSAPAPKPALKVPIPSGRTQADFPVSHLRFPVSSDPLGLTSTQPSKLAA